jgi:hypothetical protein
MGISFILSLIKRIILGLSESDEVVGWHGIELSFETALPSRT